MKTIVLGAAMTMLAVSMPALAQHDHHAGHPSPPPPLQAQEAHQGHDDQDHGEPPPPPDPSAGHEGHGAVQGQGDAAGSAPPPAIPADHAADRYFDPAEMARARDLLAYEAGGMPASLVLLDRLEVRPGQGHDLYAWKGEAWFGGDIDRVLIKSEGEGAFGGPLERAEVQLLWSRALDPWFNLQLGARHDFRPQPQRTHAVIGIEGLAPYWIEVEGQLFLSDKGELTARMAASHDQRITQRLILQSSVEIELAAQDVRERGIGKGLSGIEAGMRLRYEVVKEFAPYIGLHWERKIGNTADYARARGESADDLRFTTGVRIFF